MRYRWVLIASLLLALHAFAQAPASDAARHAFTAKDWAAMHSAVAIAVSPAGTILYVVTYADKNCRTVRDWWTIESDGTHAAKLELPEGFAPEGYTRDASSLYGTWEVNHLAQFAIFQLRDSKTPSVPTTVVTLPRGIDSALPNPQGNSFAIVADPRPADAFEDVRHIWEPDLSSVYVVHADGTGGSWWCPSINHVSGGVQGTGALAWNEDGQSLAVISATPRVGYHIARTSIDVCSGSAAHHVATIPNAAAHVAWIDEGRRIAVISTQTETVTPEHLFTVPASGGEASDVTPQLDGTAMQLRDDASGRTWVLINRGVRAEIDELVGDALIPRYQWPAGVIDSLPIGSPYPGTSHQVAINIGDPTHAPNVAVPDGDHLRRITTEGDAQLGSIDLGSLRVVHWTSRGGIALEGIATFPAGYVEGQKYKFLVMPHGGPEYNDKLALDARARTIAALGYVVLQPEFRGSTGYGSAFTAAIYQHFGDRAYQDVDSATDYAIAQGWADPSRLAIFGWSGGGFLTAWTVTQTSRYNAAIEGAGITDVAPYVWTSDLKQLDYDARWSDEDPQAFQKFSAVYFAGKVTTPILILHGESDRRVPTFEGVEFFQILAARGKTVRMVTYPGSPHFPTRWDQRLDVMNEISEWLGKYNP